MRPILLAAVLVPVLLAQNSKTFTVKENNYPLRAGCSESEIEIARLRQGDPVRIRFALTGSGGRSCYSVSVEVEGTRVNGYVWADGLTGLEEFERSRRSAAQVVRRETPPPEYSRSPSPRPPAPGVAAPIALTSKGPVPEFTVPALDNPGQTYSSSSMRGKRYLIDFWATWCGPCIAEMPNLHRAYERFKYQNFEILSISLDRSPAEVASFRHGKWTMPWLHAFSRGMWDSEAARQFGIRAIPTPILVDSSGNVLARGAMLTGGSLEQFLERALSQ